MACPHIGGIIALLWSKFDKLRRNVDETIKLLQKVSLKQESTDCKSPNKTPNYVYGYGTVDALKAYQLALELYQ